MSDEAMFRRARAFFDRKQGVEKIADPELKKYVSRLQTQVQAARGDKEFRASLLKTLAVLERDIQNRKADTLAMLKNQGGKNEQQMAVEATRAIPRELRYLQAAGLSLVQGLSENTRMTERELRKFTERASGFAGRVDKLRSSDKGFSVEKRGGLSLTDRLREYQQGQLLDKQRHEDLLKKLDDTAESTKEAIHKDAELQKLGLTALFGPAAPIFQVWFEAKEDLGKLKTSAKDSLDSLRSKFKWDKEKDKEETKQEKKQTSLWERMLKVLKAKETGEPGSESLTGSLFGRLGRGARGVGRALGRTARGAGRFLGAAGRGVASVARGAWGLAGRSLGGLAAGGLGGLAAGAVAGAAYGGYKIGELINELLPDDVKEAIGNAIGKTVDFIADSGKSVGSAILSAGTGIAQFFRESGSTVKAKIQDFWSTFTDTSKSVAKAAEKNVKDFVSPQSGAAKLPTSSLSTGELARYAVNSSVDKATNFFSSTRAQRTKEALEAQMDKAGITDPRERAMFMAQMSHESRGFSSSEESFNYRDPQRIAAVSATAARAGIPAIQAAMAKGPEAIAELMYGGRMGNTQPGDAYMYRGRGATQLTGRENYQRYGERIGVDLVNNPQLASNPQIAAKIATEYWKDKGLGDAARAGNVEAVTKGINGGTNGLQERNALYQQYLAASRGSAQPVGGSGFARVSLPMPAAVGTGERAQTAGAASSSSVGKMEMKNSDFYVDDLGLVVMNRGYVG